jgi:predicted nucleotidyltransferase
MSDIWVERFKKEALPRIFLKFRPVKVVLFGSRITGRATESSDLDIIIISNYFKEIPFVKRMGELLKAAKFPKHVDYFCYTPEEFDRIKESSAIIEQALEEGLEMNIYKKYSEAFLPARINYLLIGESPPVELSNFLYNQENSGNHMLLANLVYSFFNQKLVKNKKEYLNQLKEFGIFLIDAEGEPINNIKDKKIRRGKIIKNYLALKDDILSLPIYDNTVILLLHSNVCKSIGEKLRQDFPSQKIIDIGAPRQHYYDEMFKEKIESVLTKTH